MRPRARRLWPLLVLGLSCRPDLGDPDSLVTRQRVLAIVAEPPDGPPGGVVAYRAVVAGPGGPVLDAPLSWGFCASPKPLTENNAVSTACLSHARPIDDAARATTPLDACRLFGPDPPPGGLRPRDPDATGGYFQPVRATLGADVALRLQRVSCGLPSAPLDVAVRFVNSYAANHNPTPSGVEVVGAATPGATVELRVGWQASDEETYVAYDPASRELVERLEVLAVSWFVTAGELDEEVTGAASGQHVTAARWRAPDEAGTVWVWAVLRDDRGGVAVASRPLDVSP